MAKSDLKKKVSNTKNRPSELVINRIIAFSKSYKVKNTRNTSKEN